MALSPPAPPALLALFSVACKRARISANVAMMYFLYKMKMVFVCLITYCTMQVYDNVFIQVK
jgi:hypothetical protein